MVKSIMTKETAKVVTFIYYSIGIMLYYNGRVYEGDW